MKMSASIISPVCPLYRVSVPYGSNPCSIMMRFRVGRLSDVVKGVASTKAPSFRAKRLHELSIQCPMVMRVGRA